MIIMAPADENECRQMLYTGTTLASPSVIRYPRGTGPGVPIAAEMTALAVGQAQLRREGRCGLAILAFGALVDSAQKIAERLDATIVNMRFVKPLDEQLIVSLAERHRAIITIEENAAIGGAGCGRRRSARRRRTAAAHAAHRHSGSLHRTRNARHLSRESRARSCGPERERRTLVGASDPGAHTFGQRRLSLLLTCVSTWRALSSDRRDSARRRPKGFAAGTSCGRPRKSAANDRQPRPASFGPRL